MRRRADTQPQSQGYSIPAPIGGLNARDALANMAETDAIICDNAFPQPTWVELRGGKKTLATFAGVAETVAAYNGLLTDQLYGAVVNGTVRSIYRVDGLGGGAVGAPVVGGAGNTIQPITSTRYDWAQFGTGTAEILYLLNGLDNPLLYDGTTWYSVGNATAPYALSGVTGGSPSALNLVAVYKQRLWFGQAGTFNVYYLAQNTFAGALTLLNIAPNFKLGGALATIITISIDNAAGVNDYIAFVSNQGEVVVFQGYDPSSVNTWSLAAHFRIGRPIATGRRCWQKVGSDALVICADGFILLSEALLTDRSQERNAVSDKIRKLVTDDVTSYAANFGWQVILYPIGNKIIINVPTSENGASYHYVMNTLSGAWCTFGKFSSAWNAYCWELMGDQLFYGTNGRICHADTGTSDDGAAIQAQVKPAFSYFGEKGMLKRWLNARPIFTTSGALSIGLILNIDFDNTGPTGTIPISQG